MVAVGSGGVVVCVRLAGEEAFTFEDGIVAAVFGSSFASGSCMTKAFPAMRAFVFVRILKDLATLCWSICYVVVPLWPPGWVVTLRL